MLKKTNRKTAYLAIAAAVVALLLVSVATYAWFTSNQSVRTTRADARTGQADVQLLISEYGGSQFTNAVSCYIPQVNQANREYLLPVSTADLKTFLFNSMTPDGFASSFSLDSNEEHVFHGRVYLKSQDAAHNVYFDRLNMTFGEDVQAHAAMRLGMKISTSKGTDTYIFRLDELIDTYSAEVQRTIPEGIMVIASSDAMGVPYYYPDPCVNLLDYCIQTAGDQSSGGAKALCNIPTNEIATVEYWLYLEGCDDNCINAVQMRDVALQFAFTGVITDAGAAQTAQTTQP